MKHITRTVWLLSLVSLFTDIASEMLYPVMPIYLKSIGFSVVLIGILEGIAEATAGLSKGYFGRLSDMTRKRLPFIQLGYGLSAVSKPMLAMFVFPAWVFVSRTLDRLGKGIRTGARDALLSDETDSGTKGRVFGFHRSLDTFGAVVGPALALVYLHLHPEDYRTLFLIAFLPGLAAIFATFLIKERPLPHTPEKKRPGFLDFLRYWKKSDPLYRKLVGSLLIFALFNSSDVFLLLKIQDAGVGNASVIGIYIFYNLVFAVFSYPLGIMADRIGMRKVLFLGFSTFAVVYMGMAYARTLGIFWFLFFLYGVYAGATEGIAKAWITNICDAKDTATAVGTYTAFQSIATLVSSSFAGIVWYYFGASVPFLLSGGIAVLVGIYILRLREVPWPV